MHLFRLIKTEMIILMVVHDSTVPGQIDPMGCGDNLELESSRIYNA